MKETFLPFLHCKWFGYVSIRNARKFNLKIAILSYFLFFFSTSYGQLIDSHTGSSQTICHSPGAMCSGDARQGRTGNSQRLRNSPPPRVQNGNGTLGQTYNNTACGLDYVQGSVLIERRSVNYSFNTNGTGLPSQVTISGMPACFVIDKAYLWFTSSYFSNAPPATNVTITNPLAVANAYVPALIGTDVTKCWTIAGEQGTAVYRADVTSNISGNGIYQFNITGFTGTGNGSNEIDGATLMIIYRNPAVTWQGSLIIWDGAMTCGGPNNYNNNTFIETQVMTGFTACSASSFANSFLVVSDCQANVNGNQHTSTLNGTPSIFTNDFYNFDVAATNVTSGQNSCTCSINDQNDCFCLSLTGLYYRTANCVACTPASALSLTASINPASCNQCNGSASVSATGGATPYTYAWSTAGQTTQSVSGLCTGTYYVTVTDFTHCNVSIDTINVAPSSGFTANISSQIHATCAGSCNGSSTAGQLGGTAPFSYLWLPSNQTTQNATALCAGTYTVAVRDSNNCVSSTTVTITEPGILVASSTNTNVACNGGNNATATASSTGGTSPFNYLWNNGQTVASVSSLSAGAYMVTITDGHNCFSTTSITITEPPLLTATTSSANVLCNGGLTGVAAVTATGGTGPYVYVWTGSFQTTQSISGLSAGNYTCVVADAHNCTYSITATLTEPPAVSLATVVTNVSCNGQCNGSSTVSLTGGAAPYIYLWNNGQASASATSLCAGSFNVTIADANNCTSSASITISEPTALSSSAASTNILCNGSNSGSAGITVSGGTMPFVYSWSNGQATSLISSLSAGSYSVTVTDAHNCPTVNSVTITEPSRLTAMTVHTDNPCHGSNVGTASVAIAGGTPGYHYNWNNGGGTSSVTGLQAGNYIVTITDANNCTITSIATVTEPGAIGLNAQNTRNVLCNSQCNGSSTAIASGGAAPYLYQWNNGQVTANATSLCAGSYTVTVTDAHNCTSVTTVTINQPAALSALVRAINPICVGESAIVSVNIGGGTPAYSYSWSNGMAGSQVTVSPTGSTIYSVTITDANGCSSTSASTLIVNYPPYVNAGSDTTIMAGTSVMLTATGSGVKYLWSPETDLSCVDCNTPLANPIKTTTYIVWTTDVNGCRSRDTVTVFVDDVLTLFIPNAFRPGSDDLKNAIFYAYGIGISDFEFYIFDRWGNRIFESYDAGKGWDGSFLGKQVQEDVYVYRAKARSVTGKSITKTGSITVVK